MRLVLSAALPFFLVAATARAGSGSGDLLSSLVKQGAPWRTGRANSEQRQPVYLGLTPLQLAVGLSTAAPAVLPTSLREDGQAQAARLVDALGLSRATLEAWPARDDQGRLVWAFARWRSGWEQPWRWIDAAPMADLDAPPFLPRTLRMSVPEQRREVFADFSELDGLYDKPVFGDCVWMREEGEVVAGWLDPEEREAHGRSGVDPAPVCRVLPQPVVVNGAPTTFILQVDAGRVSWPEDLAWRQPRSLDAGVAPQPPPLRFPAGLKERLRSMVLSLDGESELVFPDGRRLTLTRKNSAESGHQLEELTDYLEARYAALGLKTRRQRFAWRGLPQSNLIAVIPGSLPPCENRPVLLVDHVDTAFAEDVFKSSRTRVSVPGADDDALATAALLEAAAVLKDSRPRHDIWLTHLTGEEYPADDLGARRLVGELLAQRRRLTGAIVMDMIGYREAGDPVFQISAGPDRSSERLARAAYAAALREAPGFTPRLLARPHPESYLYNTDALIFSEAGYPAILLNEHINALFNLERRFYHDGGDMAAHVDFAFAAAVARTAIAAAAAMAGVADPAPRLPDDHLPVPLVRQSRPYSCGAAVMQSVFAYWRVYDGGEDGLYGLLHTTVNDGTDPRAMEAAARARGLSADLREETTLEDLRAALGRGETVVLDLQAWREDDPTPEAWEDNWEDGHYVVLVGMDDRNLYLMDPSVSGSYAFLPIEELDERWHDYEDRGGAVWRDRGLALFVSGKEHAAGYPAPLQRMR